MHTILSAIYNGSISIAAQLEWLQMCLSNVSDGVAVGCSCLSVHRLTSATKYNKTGTLS